MTAALLPPDEPARLKALYRYGVLDSAAEETFDRLTRVAARLFDVPIALVSLVDVDRQWFKSCHGLDTTGTPRSQAFCAHALLVPDDILEVCDPQADPRFADNPLVTGAPHIRYYAGTPLVTSDGRALGTFCIIDQRTRPPLTPAQRDSLEALGAAALVALELRLERLDRAIAVAAATDLEGLAAQRLGHLAHELKTPLTAILGYSQLARMQGGAAQRSDSDRLDSYVDNIERAGRHMLELVDSLLSPMRNSSPGGPDLGTLSLPALFEDVARLTMPLVTGRGMKLDMPPPADQPTVEADPLRLRQILINFITNAVKYAGIGTITARAIPAPAGRLRITVRDQGPGIAPDDQPHLFDDGWRASAAADQDGFGHGLALSRLAAQTMGGRLGVDSVPGAGATFWVELPVAGNSA